jgi:hypothetical protein
MRSGKDKGVSPEGRRDPQRPPLPDGFERVARERHRQEAHPELPVEAYLALQTAEFHRHADLEQGVALRYQPALGTMTPCGNGDLETMLDPAEWLGAYGALNSGSPGSINFGVLTAGLYPGGIKDQAPDKYDFSQQAHQTWVPAGTDYFVGIPTTAPGSSGAVRIGNAITGGGCELLSKTFVVTPSTATITFWYAVVLHNPDPDTHTANTQPYFMVRVTDASGAVVPGAFDFGTGSDMLVADSTNPFFKTTTDPDSGEPLVYRDWSADQIDLTSQVGKQVTIEFITADCWHTGHWGYAYIDRFCGSCEGSPTGCLAFDAQSSTACGPGRLCFGYQLPAAADALGQPLPGAQVTITLDLYQDGRPVAQLTSPVLTGGSSYCFEITPASIPGIDTSLGGFDWAATGAFSLDKKAVGSVRVGAAPEGMTPGTNNDYQVACRGCADVRRDQDRLLARECSGKANLLPRVRCDGRRETRPEPGGCRCECAAVELPKVEPCISVAWGDSRCDCMETDDVEVLCVTVCNCYSNVTFKDLSIGRVRITDVAGNPVADLPDGSPSVRVIPSGPLCFGDVGPCTRTGPTCVSRELVLYTRGAVGKDYRLSFEAVCFSVCHTIQAEQCFVVRLCAD